MSYEIREYSEDYLEKQVEIGTKILSNWLFASQTNLENLKQVYSGENFDPSTKFYAFLGDEMVGFLTARIQPKQEDQLLTARLEFPIVLEEHRGNVEKMLLEKAYATLKEKEVKRVLSRAAPHWDNTEELAKKYNYTEESIATMGSKIALEALSFQKDQSLELLDYNAERDDESLIKMYTEKLGATEDFIKNQLKALKDPEKFNLLCWKIAKEEGEVIASSLAYMTPNDESQVYFTTPYTKDNMEGYTTSIFAYHLEKAKEKGAIEVNFFLPQNRIKDAPLFEKLGFKFSQIKMYEKKL